MPKDELVCEIASLSYYSSVIIEFLIIHVLAPTLRRSLLYAKFLFIEIVPEIHVKEFGDNLLHSKFIYKDQVFNTCLSTTGVKSTEQLSESRSGTLDVKSCLFFL